MERLAHNPKLDKDSKMSKQLPLRLTARVLVVKNGRICLGRVWNDQQRIAYYTFPGGGVEEGQTLISALQQECLEEVGFAIHQIEKLDLIVEAKHPMGSPERDKIWCGSITHYYKAQWERYDNSQRNAVGDAMYYSWELPGNAIKIIERGPDDPFNEYRIQAIRSIVEHVPHSGRLKVAEYRAQA